MDTISARKLVEGFVVAAAALSLLYAGTAAADESRASVNAVGKQLTADEITDALKPKPKVRGVKRARENAIMTILTFDTGSSTLTPSSKIVLEEFGKAAKSGLSGVPITIEGHADPRGSNEYNMDLSRQRAEAVRDFLIQELKVDSKQLRIAAMGKTQPKDAANPEAEINRRVEFVTKNPAD